MRNVKPYKRDNIGVYFSSTQPRAKSTSIEKFGDFLHLPESKIQIEFFQLKICQKRAKKKKSNRDVILKGAYIN
jgi:hypothetical protein